MAIRCSLTFDDTKAALHAVETWEAILCPLPQLPSADDMVAVDYDDRDLVQTAPQNVVYALPVAPIHTAAYFTKLQTQLKDRLVRDQSVELQRNAALKLFSRPGEASDAFAQRCTAAADESADAETDKIRQRLAARMDRLRAAISEGQLKAQQAQEQVATSRTQEMMSGAGSVLGALFGGRRSASSISGAVNRAASSRSRSQKAGDRVETAMARIEQKSADLSELETELGDAISDITDRWADVAAQIETVDVRLEKSDIVIEQIALVWVPTSG